MPNDFQELTNTDRLRSDLRVRSVRAALFSGSASFFDFALRIGSTAVLARLVLPEHFGLVMMVTAVTAIADQFKDLGLSAATVQLKDITHEQATNLFWINLSISALIAVVTCALSPLISAYYREPRLTLLTCILAVNFVFGGLMIQHQALLTRQLKLGHTAGVRLAGSLISTLMAIYLAWEGFGYWALIWREVIRTALLTVGMWICFPWVPSLPFWNTSIRTIIGFGANLTGANIVGSTAAASDRFFLGRSWGAEPVAIFRQAYQLLLAPMDQLLSPIYQVTMPGLSMLQTDDARYQRFYRKVLLMVCVATMPFSLFVAVYSSEITLLLLGPRWIDCAPILAILSLSAFIKQPVESTSMVLITRNQSSRYLVLSTVQNAALVVFMFTGARWGAIGTAIAEVSLTYLLIGPKVTYALKGSPISLRMFFSTVANPILASIGMAAALVTLRSMSSTSNGTTLLVTGCATAAVFFVAVWAMLPGGKTELKNLFNELRSAALNRSLKTPFIKAASTG